MFIDANDDKWRLRANEATAASRPLSVCFSDEYGNSFLNRVKECIGKSIVLSLSIPFRCFVEDTKTNHEKREGFLVVNDYKGMAIAYGLAQKWREDFIPLLRKQDIRYLRKRNILCFLDYGSVFLEFSRNIMIQKEDMGRVVDFPFLSHFGKSPARFLYDFTHRKKLMPMGARKKGVQTIHPLCQNRLTELNGEGIAYEVKGISENGCTVEMTDADEKRAYQFLKKKGYIQKGLAKDGETLWVLEKVPVYANEDEIFIESNQCEWLRVAYLCIKKAPL